jgi:hypothetical protein
MGFDIQFVELDCPFWGGSTYSIADEAVTREWLQSGEGRWQNNCPWPTNPKCLLLVQSGHPHVSVNSNRLPPSGLVVESSVIPPLNANSSKNVAICAVRARDRSVGDDNTSGQANVDGSSIGPALSF